MVSTVNSSASLTDWISTLAVLVAGSTVMQNSLLLPYRWPKPSPVVTAPTQGGIARLSWFQWLVTY